MTARIKKFTLKKMSAAKFEALLKELGACRPARKWAKGKTLSKIWATCDNADWMYWLLYKISQRDIERAEVIDPIIQKGCNINWSGVEDEDKKEIAFYRKYVKVI